MADKLTICDVGPRDGLQNQPVHVAASDKRLLIARLYDAGLRAIEATSFVSPQAVPQMADADEVMPCTRALAGLRAFALLMNDKGYERARAAGTSAITVVVVCSESLALKNNRRTSRETLDTARRIVELARKDDVYVRVALAAAWHCPYDGKVDRGPGARLRRGSLRAGHPGAVGRRHHRPRAAVRGARARRRSSSPVTAREDLGAPARHAGHGHGQRLRGARRRSAQPGRERGRARRLSVRQGRSGQSRHRRSGLARRQGRPRDGRRSRRAVARRRGGRAHGAEAGGRPLEGLVAEPAAPASRQAAG